MKFICLFCPAFISLYIFYIRNKNLNKVHYLIYYFISLMTINFVILCISKFIFKLYSYDFTIQFSIKYLILGSFISIFLPDLFKQVEKIPLEKNIFILIKDYLNKIKKYLNKIKNYLNNHKRVIYTLFFVILFTILFYSFDIFLRLLIFKKNAFYNVYSFCPNILTIVFCISFSLILVFVPKILSQILLSLSYLIYFILFLVHYMLINIKDQAFSIYDIKNAVEGFKFFNFIKSEISIKLILFIIFTIILFVLCILCNNKIKRNKFSLKKLFIVFVIIGIFFITKIIAIHLLDNYDKKSWEAITYPKYHYDNFVDSNKSFLVLGFYEYTNRDVYLYFKDLKQTYGSTDEIDEFFAKLDNDYANDYTGIFEGKNLVLIQLESIDNMFINDDVMPTLNYLRKKGWDFRGRYSNNISTIASEYATLTGLFYLESQYNINNNKYSESLPNIFKNVGYSTHSVHENSGKYYNRSTLHKKIGFENSYFLYDILENPEYFKDPQIIENDEIYSNIISKNLEPFMSFIITISAHGPYSNNGYCLNELGDNYTETECIKYVSSLTDNMLELLLNRLKKDNLLKNTVIILYSDHYPYAYEYYDDEKLSELDNNVNIPFIIYSKDIKSKKIDTLFSDIDILPTILNLFGLEYNPNLYIGTDIFSKSHKNICLMSDYSWYDGNYVDNSSEYYKDINKYVYDRLNINKMIISNDYYKNIY